MSTGTALLLFSTAVGLALVGSLIRYDRRVALIAGYDPGTVADEEALAEFLGSQVLALAAVSAVVAVVVLVQPVEEMLAVWVVYTAVSVAVTVRLVLGARRYDMLS